MAGIMGRILIFILYKELKKTKQEIKKPKNWAHEMNREVSKDDIQISPKEKEKMFKLH